MSSSKYSIREADLTLAQKRSVSLTFIVRSPNCFSVPERTRRGTDASGSMHTGATEECKKRLRHKGFLQRDASRYFTMQFGAKRNLCDNCTKHRRASGRLPGGCEYLETCLAALIFSDCWCQSAMTIVASHGAGRVNGSMSQPGANAGAGRDRMAEAVTCPPESFSMDRCMEATMRFFDSTSAVMALIMAGVFAPITIIHFLATTVFH